MLETTEILWTPAGQNLPSLGAKSLVDVSDGDTPNIRVPIRMLSIDTPEVTARSKQGAATVDEKFRQLAVWIKEGKAPVSTTFGKYIRPKLEKTDAGTLQFEQGKKASAYSKKKIQERLTRPDSGKQRNLFVRTADSPFDHYGRLLAYVAPSYSARERKMMTRRQRATFNLDMIESGWAAPFIIFPSIPGELELPLFLEMAVQARDMKRGQYENPLSLPGYEYRMCEKLFAITRKIVEGASLPYEEQLRWRSRYCADMRSRRLFGPEEYQAIPEPYRLWIWPQDVQQAISMLNLVPTT